LVAIAVSFGFGGLGPPGTTQPAFDLQIFNVVFEQSMAGLVPATSRRANARLLLSSITCVPAGTKTMQRRNSMPAAFFVVRAIVPDAAQRAAFDKWYETEHLPDAVKSFGVTKAWRFWGLSDPSLHQATYQFDDAASLDRAMKGEELKRLVADFNRDWPDIKRTRETFVLAQEFSAER
jgi:hypothetical protein